MATAGTVLDPRWVLPIFIGAWCAMLTLISRAGGWHALSRRFATDRSADGTLYPFASIGLGPGRFPVNYSGCLFVRLAPSGVFLSVLLPFRVGHPPLFIPWSAVSECRQERSWFVTNTAVFLSDPKTRLLFGGGLGKAIYDSWSARNLQRIPHSGKP